MIRRPPRSTLSSSSAASDVYKRQDALRRALAGWQLNVDNHDSRRLILVQEVHLQLEMNAARTQWLQGFWRPRPPAHLRTTPAEDRGKEVEPHRADAGGEAEQPRLQPETRQVEGHGGRNQAQDDGHRGRRRQSEASPTRSQRDGVGTRGGRWGRRRRLHFRPWSALWYRTGRTVAPRER